MTCNLSEHGKATASRPSSRWSRRQSRPPVTLTPTKRRAGMPFEPVKLGAMTWRASRAVAGEDRSPVLMRLIRETHARVFDVLVAVVLSLAGVAIMAARPSEGGEFRDNDALGVALVLLQTAPLAFRRVAPLGVTIVISVAVVTHSA